MQCDNKTDEEIVALVVKDRQAFACLVERYEAQLRRYLRRIMPGIGEDIDDVLQDIFIKVYVHVRGFDATYSFSSWIYRIAHNEAVSWLRKKKARPETVELEEDDFATFSHSILESEMHRAQHVTKDAVARTLVALPEKYRTVLMLKFLEGKTYEEISDILTIPMGTVATLLHRAKKKFTNIYTYHEQHQ